MLSNLHKEYILKKIKENFQVQMYQKRSLPSIHQPGYNKSSQNKEKTNTSKAIKKRFVRLTNLQLPMWFVLSNVCLLSVLFVCSSRILYIDKIDAGRVQ